VSLPHAKLECLKIDLGEIPLPDAEKLMLHLSEERHRGSVPDAVIFAAHPKTVSVGLRDGRSPWPRDILVTPDRLAREGIALVKSVRGGGVTFHWPGQVVCYPVLALRHRERDVRRYMSQLECVALECLASLGVHGKLDASSARHIGVWVGKRKVVSMGVRISRWITSFGFALNLDGDYRQAAYVRPCGLDGVGLITLEEILGTPPSRSDAIEAIKRAVEAHLHREFRSAVYDTRAKSVHTGWITRRTEDRRRQGVGYIR